MNMKRKVLLVAVFAVTAAAMIFLFSANTTSAQDRNLPPTYGSVTLRAGFVPDPVVTEVVAGGTIHSSRGDVPAYVSNAPAFRVRYVAGNVPVPLTFHVESGAATTLLINLPDGTWLAASDTSAGMNPMIRLPGPKSGRYDIWVGTMEPATAPAVLYVTQRR
jgi:hypothetical protein